MCLAMVHALIMVSNIHYVGMLYMLLRKMESTIKHSSSIHELARSVLDTSQLDVQTCSRFVNGLIVFPLCRRTGTQIDSTGF
jgi:hypothetical protein